MQQLRLLLFEVAGNGVQGVVHCGGAHMASCLGNLNA